MDDKFSWLKLKVYLLSYIEVEQQQYQQNLILEDNKDGILTGPSTYVSSMTIGRNPYISRINPADFCKHLWSVQSVPQE